MELSRIEVAFEGPRRGLGAVWRSLCELAFTPRCAACGAGSRAAFCAACAGAIDAAVGCPRCASPGERGLLCGHCIVEPPAFERLAAGGLFGGPLADAVHALKYRDRPALARPLGAWLAGRLGPVAADAVVNVPLGVKRRRTRGYDQAALLSDALARELGLSRAKGALLRVRETQPQVGKSRAARRRNVRGAFGAAGDLAGARILLVDDVCTTGATLDAAARALREAGARTVVAACLARAE